MKCEKCNEKEAAFYYSCSINGEKTEKHLCADCAKAEGFGEMFEERPMAAFDEMFNGFLDDFFAPRRSLLSAFDVFDTSLRRMMAPALPRIHVVIGEPQTSSTPRPQSEAEAKIPEDAGAEVKSRREISMLKHQLREAVRTEDFEKAIELRDKLKELEK